ncbi:MAG TPA: hypothetical protein VK028_07525 [Micromonosporaceae bacterium]|nr:hypothetical protein [Micromonosporaceae bacterium]
MTEPIGTSSVIPEPRAAADGDLAEPAPRLEVSVAARVARTVLMLAGGAGALAVAWTNPDRGTEPAWHLWAALATFLGLVSGSSIGSGVARWQEVRRIQRVPVHRVLPVVVVFVLLACASLPLAAIYVGDALSWRGVAFAGIAIVGALPAGAALAAIRSLALHGIDGPPGRQLAGLLSLRRILTRLLSILGSLVVLITLLNAAGLNWGSGPQLPVSAVVFAGAAGTVLVGILYIPTAALLRRRCVAFVDQHFGLESVPRSQLVTAVDERIKLEEILAVNRTTLGELRAALLIVSPLLAGAASALLPLA